MLPEPPAALPMVTEPAEAVAPSEIVALRAPLAPTVGSPVAARRSEPETASVPVPDAPAPTVSESRLRPARRRSPSACPPSAPMVSSSVEVQSDCVPLTVAAPLLPAAAPIAAVSEATAPPASTVAWPVPLPPIAMAAASSREPLPVTSSAGTEGGAAAQRERRSRCRAAAFDRQSASARGAERQLGVDGELEPVPVTLAVPEPPAAAPKVAEAAVALPPLSTVSSPLPAAPKCQLRRRRRGWCIAAGNLDRRAAARLRSREEAVGAGGTGRLDGQRRAAGAAERQFARSSPEAESRAR